MEEFKTDKFLVSNASWRRDFFKYISFYEQVSTQKGIRNEEPVNLVFPA